MITVMYVIYAVLGGAVIVACGLSLAVDTLTIRAERKEWESRQRRAEIQRILRLEREVGLSPAPRTPTLEEKEREVFGLDDTDSMIARIDKELAQ